MRYLEQLENCCQITRKFILDDSGSELQMSLKQLNTFLVIAQNDGKLNQKYFASYFDINEGQCSNFVKSLVLLGLIVKRPGNGNEYLLFVSDKGKQLIARLKEAMNNG